MDTRTKRMGQTNTDKNKKGGNRVHAFKTLFFIDIQKDMVKDKVSPTFGETQIGKFHRHSVKHKSGWLYNPLIFSQLGKNFFLTKQIFFPN